ncbi:MAG: hypothetical protein ABIG89_01100 [Candidatus Woesearchaeota archaeon]
MVVTVEQTIANVLSYATVLTLILLFREIFWHLIPALKGDNGFMIKARRALTERQLRDKEKADKREKGLDEREIQEEDRLKKLLGKFLRDLNEHGIREIEALRRDIKLISDSLNKLEGYEKQEVNDFEKHLSDLPGSDHLRKEMGDEKKLTLFIEKLILAAETMLTTGGDQAAVKAHMRSYIMKAIEMVNKLEKIEREEEKEL